MTDLDDRFEAYVFAPKREGIVQKWRVIQCQFVTLFSGNGITAIIPTYKRPQWLKRSVKSVLRKSFADFEILIADNASGEETDAVTQAFMEQDKRIKLLKHSTNIGAIANFQAALMQVSIPYVCFLPEKGHSDQDPAPIPHPEAHFLQDYARSLDDTYTKR